MLIETQSPQALGRHLPTDTADISRSIAMTHYRFACQLDDESWIEHSFLSSNDSLAVLYGLSKRTANKCQLFQNDRLIATYDGLVVLTGSANQAKQTPSSIVLRATLSKHQGEQFSLYQTAARPTAISATEMPRVIVNVSSVEQARTASWGR